VQTAHYLSNPGAKGYLDPAAFDRAGLGLIFQEFSHYMRTIRDAAIAYDADALLESV
jgi:hypothetical protein